MADIFVADILSGMVVIGVLASACFGIALHAGRHLGRRARDFAAVTMVLAIYGYAHFFWYNPRLSWVLPFSNLVVLGNWFPLAAGALGGLAWGRLPGRWFRKLLFLGGLAGASVYSMVYPLMGESPECGNAWSSDICLQTTPLTCTPACAATLLRAHGISVSEGEMAKACLTRDGSTWMGLYRGLKLKTQHTDWDVEVLCCDAAELVKQDGPLIMAVGLPPRETSEDHLKMAEWGWKKGVGHSVIFLRQRSCGRFLVADPTPGWGQENWSRQDLEYLFRGTAMRLVKRY
ncbi:MAG: hypothetical protein AB7F89_10890 [Pirellulaceae bacterium]